MSLEHTPYLLREFNHLRDLEDKLLKDIAIVRVCHSHLKSLELTCLKEGLHPCYKVTHIATHSGVHTHLRQQIFVGTSTNYTI